MKLNPNFNVIWNSTFNLSSYTYIKSYNSNIYIFYRNSCPVGCNDTYFSKFDSSGLHLWTKTQYFTGVSYQIYNTSISKDGQILMTGGAGLNKLNFGVF